MGTQEPITHRLITVFHCETCTEQADLHELMSISLPGWLVVFKVLLVSEEASPVTHVTRTPSCS